MADKFEVPVVDGTIAAQAALEQKNEIVALNDTDGSWKLDLGKGFHTQWEQITALLTTSLDEDAVEASSHGGNSSINDAADITEEKVFIISLLGNTSSGKSFITRCLLSDSEDTDLVNGPVCIDEAEKKGATTTNINCYLKKFTNNQKTIVLDYEGEKGSGFPLLQFAQQRLARVSRTAEKAQQRRQAVTDYFPKLAYILSNVVILIGNDDLASTDYLTRCREFALKANDGVNHMVNPPMLIIIQNKGSVVQSQNYEEITKKFFDIHGQEAAVLERYFSDIKCFCLPHRAQLQRTKNGLKDGQVIFNQQIVGMKEIFLKSYNDSLERALTNAQWLYLLQRVLPIVQQGESVSLHTLLSEIVAPDGEKMIDISRRCFLYAYEKQAIHSPAWFYCCCYFAIRVMTHFLAVQNYHRQELMSECVVSEQCDKALSELSKKLDEFQPCEALYSGKGRSSKKNDTEKRIYCYQHKGAHRDGHRTCQSVYGLTRLSEFFGWSLTDIWQGDFISSTKNKFKNTIFPKAMVKDMSSMIKDLVTIFRQDQYAVYDMFAVLLNEQFSEKSPMIFRRICFHPLKPASPLGGSLRLDNDQRHTLSRRLLYQQSLAELFLKSVKATINGFGSCDECQEKLHASWNRLLSIPRPPPAQISQVAVEEVQGCAICFDGLRNFLLIPCGHRGYCEKCADEILREAGYCPFCRAPVSAKQRVIDV
ncbi:unnamed protein product [Adineta steineri]|uniref:RING-type domain-containing protein n=1 Tax=Adineta steineri TaxID=433720 RepID=A0A814FFS0_9BILA|nr:unnamed protein product [Adineta steineri]CAF1011270.1 unnamed protein product [Adineta steineri]